MRASRRDAAAAGALAGLALALRLRLLGAAPYGDEAAHYTMARTLGFLDRSILWIGAAGDKPVLLYPLTLGRPLFTLLHFPAAQAGFMAFRLSAIAIAALLPALVYALVRAHGTRAAPALVAGVAVAIHPAFVVWGARAFPDTPMAVLAIAGLLAWTLGHRKAATVLLLAACLVKETAIPILGALAALAFVEGVRQRWRDGARGAPLLRPRREETWPALAFAASFAGVFASFLTQHLLPGWGRGGEPLQALDILLLSSWLVVPGAVAAGIHRTRALGTAFLALLAFYALHVVVRDGQVNSWYAILPAALAIAAAAVLVDSALRSRGAARLLAPVAATGLCFALVVATVGAGGSLSAALHPFNGHDEPGLNEAIRFAHDEDAFLREAMRFQDEQDPAKVLQIDLAWYWIGYPFAGNVGTKFAFTLTPSDNVPLERVLAEGETSDLTWVQDWDTPFHQAFKVAYADCQAFEASFLSAYRLQDCPGRAPQVLEAMGQEQG